ncbi:MAG: ribbon-helix-helix protein, CopG family [Leptolyngbya sp. BL-A-14]
MSQQPMVGCRVPSAWHEEIIAITEATGQSSSEVVREAIALYLKKSKAVTVRSRLDDLEQRLNKLTLLVTQ